jgi:hypothetical protein
MKNINFKELITRKWLFGIDRVVLHPFDRAVFIAGIVAVVLGIIIKVGSLFVKNPFLKKGLNRLATLSIVIGVLELLWYALRFENTQVLGTHFVALLIALAGLIWFIFVVKYFLFQYRRDVEQYKKDLLKQKYLNQNPR